MIAIVILAFLIIKLINFLVLILYLKIKFYFIIFLLGFSLVHLIDPI